MKHQWIIVGALLIAHPLIAVGNDQAVGISSTLERLEVQHRGQTVVIERNPDTANRVDDEFALTSRPCPPFCVQPMTIAPGVETIGELELMDLMEKHDFGEIDALVIDSRTPDWAAKGMIPSAVNIPWSSLSLNKSDPLTIADILETQFGVVQSDGLWDFSNAKILLLYCNGPWCGQSPTNIQTLLTLGYPAHKIKWYRGGMQAWESLGLTTVKP
jgi:rhodanese-related sulfurtransferase